VKQLRSNRFEYGLGLWVAVLVFASSSIFAADQTSDAPGSQKTNVFPLVNDQTPAYLSFDLGGSETRKLALRLDQSLTFSIAGNLRKSSSGVGSVFYNSGLNLALNDKLDITASLGAGKSRPAFQPLGSIMCQNGVLEMGSLRASDCYFINQANVLQQDQVALGLRYGTGKLSTAVNMFQRGASSGQPGTYSPLTPLSGVQMDAGLLMPAQSSSPFSTPSLDGSLNYLKSETSGINLEFKLGLATDDAGDVRLGLQLTRVLDASYEASSLLVPTPQNWAIASPFDSARLSLDWSKGNFSGGIQSFYRDQVQFLNRSSLDSMATFDVQFTWRTPWNANLSVGTSNVLNAGEDRGKNDTGLKDPFESVYGRIPYVRYQQDL